MSTPLVWSPSRSTRWRTCRRQFLLKDLLAAEPAQHAARRNLRGNVMHAGMEAALRTVAAGKYRHATSMAAFFGEAETAMREHPSAAELPAADLADCVGIVYAALTGLGVPAPGSILGVEMPFTFVHHGMPVKGIIDLALRTGPVSARVIDWKSGRIPERSEQLEGNTALGVYSVAAMRAFPWARTIEVCLHSIPRAQSVQLVITREMQELVLERLAGDFHAAESARARLAPESVDDLFPASTGDHCTSCVFRSYCPEFRDSSPPVRPGVDVDAERERLAARIALTG